jgi:hypothetical protein
MTAAGLTAAFDDEARRPRPAADDAHRAENLKLHAVLDGPAPRKKELRELTQALTEAHRRGDVALVLPQQLPIVAGPMAPGAPGGAQGAADFAETNRPFLALVRATVAAHNGTGHELRDAVALLLSVLHDCGKTSPVTAFCQQRNATAAQHALGDLATLAAQLPTPHKDLCELVDALDTAHVIPNRFAAILKAVLRARVTAADLQLALLRATLAFFRSVCCRVAKLRETATTCLEDSCAACSGVDDPGRVFLVALRTMPSAGRDTPRPVQARAPLLHALQLECDQRGADTAPSILEYGEYLFARGHWIGEDGYAAACDFGRVAQKIVFEHNIVVDQLPQNVPDDIVRSFYDVDVLFDTLDVKVNDLDINGLFFGHGPFRPPNCVFMGTPADVAGAERCRKRNTLKYKSGLDPGLVTFSCTHRVVYGFLVMREFESPRMLFQAIRQYFVWPPRIVVYDLACVLDKFASARNPSVFADVLFLIDKFHQVRFFFFLFFFAAITLSKS